MRRHMLDAGKSLNQHRFQQLHDPEIQTRVEQHEMAFRMRSAPFTTLKPKRDLHAILDQFGLDHEQLAVPFQGLSQKLVGVGPRARVVTEILG
jgi:hypothetical protein